MASEVEIGPVLTKRGTKAFKFLKVATGGDGGDLGIPVHVIAGGQPGPRVVVMSSAHGYETRQISALQAVHEQLDPEHMIGELVLIPVANPVAFEMGTRGTWIDSLWGDSGNMNRMWPGRPNGWLTERFCHAIATQVFEGATVVMDFHGFTPQLALAYGYIGVGDENSLDYQVSRVFGHELLVYNPPEDLVEKRQTSGTSKVYLRSKNIAAYSCEIGEFYGVEGQRGSHSEEELFRGVPEVGVTGITNVMKHLKMIPGDLVRPKIQLRVEPELNLRPSHGGVVVTNFGVKDLGRVLPRGTVLGTVISPYTFETLEEIVAPFEENLLLATLFQQPFTRVNPGDYGYIVADHGRTQELS